MARTFFALAALAAIVTTAQGMKTMCSSDSDCPWALKCDGSYCQDPCEGNAVEDDDLECGSNSECVGWRHRPLCRCMQGYERSLAGEGDGGCVEVPTPAPCSSDADCEYDERCPTEEDGGSNDAGVRRCAKLCDPSPCGRGAVCGVVHRSRRFVCRCPKGRDGDPYVECE